MSNEISLNDKFFDAVRVMEDGRPHPDTIETAEKFAKMIEDITEMVVYKKKIFINYQSPAFLRSNGSKYYRHNEIIVEGKQGEFGSSVVFLPPTYTQDNEVDIVAIQD